jgi:hypothetical protein
MRAAGISGAVVAIKKLRILTPIELAHRAAACEDCLWNLTDKCQHPRQTCPPCKQGQKLSIARAASNFKCPNNLFPNL